MKPKLTLCLTLVLIGILFGCSTTARADETNMPALTNAAQSYATATVKTNWMDAKVTLYRTTGGVVQLDAKREVVTVRYGPHTNDVDVVAFVDSDSGNAWVGSSFGFAAIFYLETESGIVRGNMLFSRLELGAPRPNEHDVINGALAFGVVIWNRSFVPSVKRGENVDAAIVQFNKNIDLKSVESGMRQERRTILENSRAGVETGLNPWLFQDEGHGSQFVETTIEAVDISNGKLRLDLKSPTGSHKASVWIDLKTWQVVKVIQDGKGLAGQPVKVADIEITFADPPVTPPRNLPKEAQCPPDFDSKEHGTFTDIVAGRIKALNVTWADPKFFKTQSQTRELLRELLSSTNTYTYNFHIWQWADVTPSVVATVEHTVGNQGKWMVWCDRSPSIYWAYLDGNGKWRWGGWDYKAPRPKSLDTERK